MKPRVQQVIGYAALIGLIFGVGTAFVIIRILLAMWGSCDIGINAGANLGGLLLYGPMFIVIAGLACGVAFACIDVWAPRAAAYTVTGLVALLVVWATVAWQHNPGGDYPEILCENNIPPWWPDFIPL